MMHFTEMDAADELTLNRALVEKVQPFLDDAKQTHTALSEEFAEATKSEREEFELRVADQHAIAERAYQPLKAACDAKCNEIFERNNRLIDKEVMKLAKAQAKLQKTFDEATAPQRAIYDEAVRPLRQVFEEKVAALSEHVQEAIKPINEEYKTISDLMAEHADRQAFTTYPSDLDSVH